MQAPGRMIVRHDDRRSTIRQRLGKHLSRMHRCSVDQTNGDHANIEDLIGTIDAGAKKMFLLPICIMSDMRKQIGWSRDLYSLGFDAASGEFNRRKYQRSLRLAHAVEPAQVVSFQTEPFFVDTSEELLRQGHHVHA